MHSFLSSRFLIKKTRIDIRDASITPAVLRIKLKSAHDADPTGAKIKISFPPIVIYGALPVNAVS